MNKIKYCDLDCQYASFPDKLHDGAYTCRTFIALYCKKLKHLVYKNAVCHIVRKSLIVHEK